MSVSAGLETGRDDASESAELVNEAGQLVGPHECQNQCGRRAAYVLVDIDEGRADIICGLCLMAMMAAVAEQVPPPGLVSDDDNAAAGH
jgi:hypothetical protein